MSNVFRDVWQIVYKIRKTATECRYSGIAGNVYTLRLSLAYSSYFYFSWHVRFLPRAALPCRLLSGINKCGHIRDSVPSQVITHVLPSPRGREETLEVFIECSLVAVLGKHVTSLGLSQAWRGKLKLWVQLRARISLQDTERSRLQDHQPRFHRNLWVLNMNPNSEQLLTASEGLTAANGGYNQVLTWSKSHVNTCNCQIRTTDWVFTDGVHCFILKMTTELKSHSLLISNVSVSNSLRWHMALIPFGFCFILRRGTCAARGAHIWEGEMSKRKWFKR